MWTPTRTVAPWTPNPTNQSSGPPFDALAPTAGGFADRAGGEVRRPLESEGRVMLEAIKLPETGEIPLDLDQDLCQRAEELRKRTGTRWNGWRSNSARVTSRSGR